MTNNVNKQLNRQRRAFNRLCQRLPDDLCAWTFAQRQEYFKLSRLFDTAHLHRVSDQQPTTDQ